MANPLDPAETALGLDISITTAAMDLRVNDVPVFDPANPFGSSANISTRIPLNPAFREGSNAVTLTLRPMEAAGEGFVTDFRARLRWWPAGEPGLPFGENAHAIELRLIRTESGTLQILAEPGTQDHLAISGLETFTDMDGAPSVSFMVEVDMALPPFAWSEAAPLEPTDQTDSEVRRAYKRLHEALSSGADAAQGALAPFIARQAAAIGATPDQFFGASLAPLFSPDAGFAIVPFDAAAGDLQLFGAGRLAAIVPIPLSFENAATGQRGTLFIYLWKDASDNWQVIH